MQIKHLYEMTWRMVKSFFLSTDDFLDLVISCKEMTSNVSLSGTEFELEFVWHRGWYRPSMSLWSRFVGRSSKPRPYYIRQLSVPACLHQSRYQPQNHHVEDECSSITVQLYSPEHSIRSTGLFPGHLIQWEDKYMLYTGGVHHPRSRIPKFSLPLLKNKMIISRKHVHIKVWRKMDMLSRSPWGCGRSSHEFIETDQ